MARHLPGSFFDVMPVVLRDAHYSARGREWFGRAYQHWLEELGALAADVAASASDVDAALAQRDREVLIIERDDQLVGFAVLQHRSTPDRPSVYLLREFYVSPEFRTLGVGDAAARLLFDRFKDRWEIRSLSSDTRAIAFWRRVTTRYTEGVVEERRERGEVVQRFLSKGAR
jgi:predicted acetyltransferase